MKKLLVRKDDKTIVFIADTAELRDGAIFADGLFFLEVNDLDVIDVDAVPDGVKAQEYQFTEVGFVRHPNYVPYHSPEEKLEAAEREIESLKRIIKQMNDDNLAFMEDVLGVLGA